MNKNINTEYRNKRKISLSAGIKSYINSLNINESDKELYKTYKVQNLFEKAIKYIYQNNYNLILKNINAVYIVNKKENYDLKNSNKAIYSKQLIIYTCNSMVYADLDSRQEFIKMWFDKNKNHVDKCVLLSSKFGMRKNFPFKKTLESYDLYEKNFHIFENDKKITKEYFTGQHYDDINNKINAISDKKLRETLSQLILN